jgi:hypothetical protein
LGVAEVVSNALGPVVAGHQPNFLPWFGYFEKMLKSDIFVFSDDVQYPKQSYTNRVEILFGGVPGYVTLPVQKGGGERIADKIYMRDDITLKKLRKTLDINLQVFPFFADVLPVIAEFEAAYWRHETVADLNVHMNCYIAGLMGITVSTNRGVALGLDEYRRNERIVQRCKKLGSSIYLCGHGADGYQDEEFFAVEGLELHRIDYSIGRYLFGDQLRFSVLQGIALRGLDAIRVAIGEYRCGSRD